jgi:hypothetical protein
MKEVNLGGTQFTTTAQAEDFYIVLSFGPEGGGKTRFPITGPEVIGYIPFERKTYSTLRKDGEALGKTIWMPKDPESLIVNPRKAKLLSVPKSASEKERETANMAIRKYYREYVDRAMDAIYAMLEHPDVNLVCIDTFTQMCSIIDSALYGFEDKFIKVEGKLYKDRREYRQEIIDFMNSLSNYKKHVILIHRQKDEYGKNGPTGRKTWEGFAQLGHYCKIIIHHETNPKWNPEANDESRSWHYALNVRTCQDQPYLEGPAGYRFLKDDEIGFPQLIMNVNPDVDIETVS